MANTGNLWWMTPLQAFATLGAAVNFGEHHTHFYAAPISLLTTLTGGSALQSPLIMPMLQLTSVPVEHAGTQTAYLLHNSEKFFPPLNAACTLANLVLTVTAYLNKNQSRVAAEKFPYLAACFGLSIATTGYALTIMVPMNRRMAVLADQLNVNSSDEKSAKELRFLQQRWTKLNLGEYLL